MQDLQHCNTSHSLCHAQSAVSAVSQSNNEAVKGLCTMIEQSCSESAVCWVIKESQKQTMHMLARGQHDVF